MLRRSLHPRSKNRSTVLWRVYWFLDLRAVVAINNVTVNGKTFVFALISRRNWHRAGWSTQEGGSTVHDLAVLHTSQTPRTTHNTTHTTAHTYTRPRDTCISYSWQLCDGVLLSCTGTRYFVRGLDADGNAANYVETEQMIWYAGQVASYVQVSPSPPPQYTSPSPVLFSSSPSETSSSVIRSFCSILSYF